MTTEKQFICECGKAFANGQSFNGHKSGCKTHMLHKYDSLDFLLEKLEKISKSSKATRAKLYEELQNKKLTTWLESSPHCEKCGSLMTEKFGSGRFCSRACANSRERSEELKQQVSEKLKIFSQLPESQNQKLHQQRLQAIEEYSKNPKHCKICDSIIEYDRRRCNTCTNRDCQITWAALQSKGNTGGLRQGSGTGKHGWYKGYYCDSSYELAYVIYNLDHNIPFSRNKKAYSYLGADNKIHKYYPDFIENNTLIEIKGYWTDTVQRKLDAVDDLPIKLLMKKDIQYMIDYVKQTYSCSDITILYES